jgi:hypothetical protein
MSEIIKELDALAARLADDGYPPALIQRAARRMEAMESVIVEQNMEIRRLNGNVGRPIGPCEHCSCENLEVLIIPPGLAAYCNNCGREVKPGE